MFFRVVDTKVIGKFVKVAPAAGMSRLKKQDLVVALLGCVGGDTDAPVVDVQAQLHKALLRGSLDSRMVAPVVCRRVNLEEFPGGRLHRRRLLS